MEQPSTVIVPSSPLRLLTTLVLSNLMMVGGILWKGHSVHIAVRPAYHCRWLKKSHLRAWRQFAHPVALFATPAADNTRAVELAERLGFVRRGRTGQSIILVKEATCPSP